MSTTMRAAKLVAESIGALLDAAQHMARCGGLEHADADYILDCGRRVWSAIEEAKDASAVEQLGELTESEDRVRVEHLLRAHPEALAPEIADMLGIPKGSGVLVIDASGGLQVRRRSS